MSNAKAQHELVGVLVNLYPELTVRLGERADVSLPEYDQVVPAPNTHPMPGRKSMSTDVTVRFLRDGKSCRFAQVELQQQYSLGKLADLRAYHGSEVRNTQCGGHMFVLSPKASETRKFRAGDAEHREEFAYVATYLSGEDLTPFAEAGRSFSERALAAATTDLKGASVPPGAPDMLLEMYGHSELVAELYLRAMLEECADMTALEEAMNDIAYERIATLPGFQPWRDKVRAEERAEARAEAEARAAEARAEAEARAAEARAEADKRAAEAQEQATLATLKNSLLTYFSAKSDTPSKHAVAEIKACTSPEIVQSWLQRAYQGDTSAQIFGNPSAD